MVVAALTLLAAVARASTPLEESQLAELDRVRARVAGEVQLSAFDLVDELVYGWVSDPPFAVPTPVVLAGVTVPVGLDTGLQAMVENHVADVLTKNPASRVELVHCPACTAVVVHSGPEATLVSRGIDDPSVLEELGAGTGRHALFLDVEAEGTWLVLRARITRLTPELPIVWAHTYTTTAGTPAMLRAPDDLKSAAAARAEYLAALRDRGPVSVPVRLGIRTYAQPGDATAVPPPPFLWLETGVQLAPDADLAWLGEVVVGYSFVPQAYQGILAQGRVERLLSGRRRSHVRPDLYGFVGASATTVWGLATSSFQDDLLTGDALLLLTAEEAPRTTFGTIQFGADLRIGNRLGFDVFLETLPSLTDSPNLGWYVRPFGLPLQAFGSEVSVWF